MMLPMILKTSQATYPADFASLDSIRTFVGAAAEQAGFSDKDVYAVKLAADEACSNIIEHAYGGGPDGEIEIVCEVQNGQITLKIHDRGREFDMSTVREPNLSSDLNEREIGGLGVFLIHRLMDEVCFKSSRKTGNTLTLVKRKSEDS